MIVRRLISAVLGVLVAAGLLFAPFVTPAVARGDVSAVAMHHGHAVAGAAVQAADDMPCCPDKQKSNDCQDCPLMAICMLKVLLDGPVAVGLPSAWSAYATLDPHDDQIIAGSTGSPPEHPPRILS